MKELDTGIQVPQSAALAIKRLEEGEPSVITHAFVYHGRTHIWLLKPVRTTHGEMIGYFALGLGQEHRFSVTTLSTGVSFNSGETYLIDGQGRILSESRFHDQLITGGLLQTGQMSVLNLRVADPGVNVVEQPPKFFVSTGLPLTLAAREVIKTHHSGSNTDGYNDYRGIPSFGVWQWDEYINAAIITEMDQAEAMSDYIYVRNLLLVVLLLVLLASLISVIEHSRLHLRLNREDQEHKNLLLESTAEAIYGVNMDGRCTFVNSSFLSLLGYQEDEVIGKNIHQLIHHSYSDGTSYPADTCRINKAQTQRKRVHHKNESFWHKNGQQVQVEYWAQPLFEHGKVLGSVVSFLSMDKQLEFTQDSNNKNHPAPLPLRVSAEDKEAVSVSNTTGNAEQKGDPLVLVVDDEEMIREIHCAMLNDMGYATKEAIDGIEGLALYQQYQQQIVCVLTDLTMPRMDGKELFNQLKKISPACSIIICSGYSADHASQQFLDQEVSAFLQKPYTEDDLKAVMDHVLGVNQ
jgi:PAS domain S-box-containing protein